MTFELADQLKITESSVVLDVACGIGTTAIALAKKYGCKIIAIDMNPQNIAIAEERAIKLEVSELIEFQIGYADQLKFTQNSFDVIICECSFCIFHQKSDVAFSFKKLLKPHGRIGISDVAIEKDLPVDIKRMIYRIACISGALSILEFKSIFENAGFHSILLEAKPQVVTELYQSLKKKLIGLKMVKAIKGHIGTVDLSEIDTDKIKQAISQVKQFVDDDYGTYFIYVGTYE